MCCHSKLTAPTKLIKPPISCNHERPAMPWPSPNTICGAISQARCRASFNIPPSTIATGFGWPILLTRGDGVGWGLSRSHPICLMPWLQPRMLAFIQTQGLTPGGWSARSYKMRKGAALFLVPAPSPCSWRANSFLRPKSASARRWNARSVKFSWPKN